MPQLFGGILIASSVRRGHTGQIGGDIALIVRGLAVMLHVPRLVKRITAREVSSPRYPCLG